MLSHKSSIVPPRHNSKTVVTKADSAASSHYWKDSDMGCLTNVEAYQGPAVTLPDNNQIAPAI